jgi:hypothetical protein
VRHAARDPRSVGTDTGIAHDRVPLAVRIAIGPAERDPDGDPRADPARADADAAADADAPAALLAHRHADAGPGLIPARRSPSPPASNGTGSQRPLSDFAV